MSALHGQTRRLGKMVMIVSAVLLWPILASADGFQWNCPVKYQGNDGMQTRVANGLIFLYINPMSLQGLTQEIINYQAEKVRSVAERVAYENSPGLASNEVTKAVGCSLIQPPVQKIPGESFSYSCDLRDVGEPGIPPC
ncbi:hypothetical protein [Pseudomonas gingeri]|uniref:Uncharacterized protein n=1 Tax=Pseudomonas gingeri TaxID=117681 RepID=A0A7Y7YIZ4_9PSED|nr:hypothetical protein [Pseudomonas gingeri]NWB28544.1 hypothetical protein [Pseudomonas gingeri]NWC37412.1 hypothetical protein [Pseudomonas gingeri]NWD09724.1 hypothetical protein [Pseudomonas gingeri]NWD47361.1 hypothetical protein [Pseudomonas gingeri]NWE36961.1 hypothetical protein [Pseudomonas gingeri]